MAGFDEFFEKATGLAPYPWQQRVAESGLPEVVDVETGAGKTAGVVLGWLYRRTVHPAAAVRAATPPWLVFALPMRSLVEQTFLNVQSWIERLDVGNEVSAYRLMGGEGRVEAGWRERPGRPTILVGTVDLLLSRALLRGYAASRWVWPMEFGLLHSGCHWVFDEVQLLGPAVATGRQLDAFRTTLGTAAPCGSTWMSATLRCSDLSTVDNPDVPTPLTLSPADHAAGLAVRLEAVRTVSELAVPEASRYEEQLAADAAAAHRPGTLTLVVVNTVKRAQTVHARLVRRAASTGPEVMLLHSRFRPADRQEVAARALDPAVDPAGPGRIVVATQVVEAGVDISAATLVTEAAPWSSIVQRAGRCNRAGEHAGARILWAAPPRPAPYPVADVEEAVAVLRSLEGEGVTTWRLRELAAGIVEERPVLPVLRRKDLFELFDTSPDLIGNDVDVSRYIRVSDETDVKVAWRALSRREPGAVGPPFDGPPLRADELCPVPIGEARTWLKDHPAWMVDHLEPSGWARADAGSLRPGAVLVAASEQGGYSPERGWEPASSRPVPVHAASRDGAGEVASVDEATGDDPATYSGAWVSLDAHLDDAARQAGSLLAELDLPGLSASHVEAVVRAAAVHDLGKAHEVFQDTLMRSAGDGERAAVERLVPLAKSAGRGRTRHVPPQFRHELASALALVPHEEALLGDIPAEHRFLVRYLVAAHHGRVRMAIRSVPADRSRGGGRGATMALGVVDGDTLPAIAMGGTVLPPVELHLGAMALGPGSWTSAALALLHDAGVGPFRLAAMEALVRLADWRASAMPTAADLTSGAGTVGR